MIAVVGCCEKTGKEWVEFQASHGADPSKYLWKDGMLYLNDELNEDKEKESPVEETPDLSLF